ncbi:MAG: hypothetical protein JW924_08375 [Fusobacteriaceae bacterium]|nr:hypothetical protein [Fusobacteriaceae bacterium]
MDINMNNVKFYKGENGDNWVYLSLDGGTTNGIKLIYDDGTYGDKLEPMVVVGN